MSKKVLDFVSLHSNSNSLIFELVEKYDSKKLSLRLPAIVLTKAGVPTCRDAAIYIFFFQIPYSIHNVGHYLGLRGINLFVAH